MTIAFKVRRRRSSRTIISAVLVVGALLMAACGGDDSESSTTTAATGGTEGGSTAATGEPIKVMTEAPIDTNLTPYPNIRDAAKFYADWINEKGGINGRPLEVIFCDDKNDPNEAGNCARKAVEEKVVANVGSFTIDVSRGIPIYEENNIAWFGACCPSWTRRTRRRSPSRWVSSAVSRPLRRSGWSMTAASRSRRPMATSRWLMSSTGFS